MPDLYYLSVEQYDIADDPEDNPPRDATKFAGDLASVQKRLATAMLELGQKDWLLVNIEPLETD